MATRLSTPWTKNPWFETVSEAQRRARKQLPSPVYSALLAGSEAGVTVTENVTAFSRLGLRPVTVGQTRGHDMATSVMGVDLSMPVMISPTGVQAVHPDGEVAVARAAAARGLAMGLSSFASKPLEAVVGANPQTFFQTYWMGGRDAMVDRLA
ncbi:MAG: mftD, partial [Citricoccus sp.]|nr:mftD [Citricoccus sp. WCRC_4]